MVIRTGLEGEPRSKFHTSKYCVAYLDILGGVNKIKADTDNKFLNLLNMLYVDVFNEAQGIFNEDKDIVVKIFSDNILLAIQTEKESPEKGKRVQRLLNAVSNIYNEALRYGVLLRGAIAVGDLFINEVFVFGAALLEGFLSGSSSKSNSTSYTSFGTRTGYCSNTSSNMTMYDDYGSRVGFTRESTYGYDVYSDNGQRKASYHKRSDGYDIYDEYGSMIGYMRKQQNGMMYKYDRYGVCTGYIREDASGRKTEYDNYGRCIGYLN